MTRRLTGALLVAISILLVMPASGHAQTHQWEKVTGAARDIAIADDGTVWVIGNTKAPGGYRIYKSSSNNIAWTAVPGAAVRIAVESETPWIVDERGIVFRWSGGRWQTVGAPQAIDVGASAKGVWIAAKPNRGGDYTIRQWLGSLSRGWKQTDAAGVRLDVDADGNPWVVDSAGKVHAINGKGQWQQFGTARDAQGRYAPASDISIHTFGAPWVVTTTGDLWYFNKASNKPSKWEKQATAANAIAQRGGLVWYLGAKQEIFRSKGIAINLPTAQLNVQQENSVKPDVITTKPDQTLTVETQTLTGPKLEIDPNAPTSQLSLNQSVTPSMLTGELTTGLDCSKTPNDSRCKPSDTQLEVHGLCDGKVVNLAEMSTLCTASTEDPYPNVHGKRVCPTVGTTKVLGATRYFLVPCKAGGPGFMWQSPQFPEPGIYELLSFNSVTKKSALLETAFADLDRVKRLIRARAENNPNVERELWEKMTESPADSPEFKALIFAALLQAIDKGASQDTYNFEKYISERRRHIFYEMQSIYNSWAQIDAVTQTEALRKMAGGVGMPVPIPLNDSGSVNPDILGADPVDAVGMAWGSAAPDGEGADALAAIKELVSLERENTESSNPLSFDRALLLPLYNTINILDTSNKLLKLKSVTNFLNSAKGEGAQLALKLVAAVVDLSVGIDRVVKIQQLQDAIKAQGESLKQYPNLKEMLNTDKGKQELLLYWVLATSDYRAGPDKGKGRITGCGNYPGLCKMIKARMEVAVKDAGIKVNPTSLSKFPKPEWVAVRDGAIPGSAVVAGKHRTGSNLVVCRADMGDGVHPGKVWGSKCNIGWGGKERVMARYDVLTAPPTAVLMWAPRKSGQAIPQRAVSAGTHRNGSPLIVCRADMGDGNHPGKVWGGKCNVGWGGREIAKAAYDVLIDQTSGTSRNFSGSVVATTVMSATSAPEQIVSGPAIPGMSSSSTPTTTSTAPTKPTTTLATRPTPTLGTGGIQAGTSLTGKSGNQTTLVARPGPAALTAGSTSGGFVWSEAKGQSLPKGALVAGKHKSGVGLVVCRADMGDGIHPGKMWNGKCHVGWGGREIAKPGFEVLTAAPDAAKWVAVRPGQPLPKDALVAGKHKSGPALLVCRADMGDGIHPGKVWNGKCNVGWGGKERAMAKYEVLLGAWR